MVPLTIIDTLLNSVVTNCVCSSSTPTQGRRCVLKDCCMVADNTVLAPETVVPAFAVFSGCPGKSFTTSSSAVPRLLPNVA